MKDSSVKHKERLKVLRATIKSLQKTIETERDWSQAQAAGLHRRNQACRKQVKRLIIAIYILSAGLIAQGIIWFLAVAITGGIK